MGCGGSSAAGGGGSGFKFAVIEAKGWKVDHDQIGDGGFATVHLCHKVGGGGEQRACKAMRLADKHDREDFLAEVNILKKINIHRNICQFVDFALDERFGYLVVQSCSGGELFDRIAARKCTEVDSAMAVFDILNALNFLHEKRILHRDLKPENLLYKDKSPGAPLKLIDFGLAMQLQPRELATEVCGTTAYMGPEVLKGRYDMCCDLWALGVIVYFMLTGTLPFPGRTDEEREFKIAKGQVSYSSKAWLNFSTDAKDFVKGLLVKDVKKRMDGHAALVRYAP